MNKRALWVIPTVFFIVAGFFSAESSFAEDPGLTGWGKDGAYNGFFKPGESDSFKGVVEDIIDITPLPEMAPGVGVIVIDQDRDTVTVHLGPKSFVKTESIGLKKGDKVKVKGAWADINGKEVFIASKVKKSEDTELKVRRTKDGTPYWTMSAEELKKEQE